MARSHNKERRREVQKAALLWNFQVSRKREEDLRLAGEDRSLKKWVEAGTNYGSWRLIEVGRAHRQPMFLGEQRTLLLLLLLLLQEYLAKTVEDTRSL
jgi:hypothetical protein